MSEFAAQAGGGWDASTIITAALAGFAALTGLVAIVMNWFMQRDQQSWQGRQEADRRSWESGQERERRAWQEAHLVGTRWDEHKRELYSDFLSLADGLYEVSGELADVRRHLAEDLANHMYMAEEHYLETEGDRLSKMTEEEKAQFWKDIYDKERSWFEERRSALSKSQADLRKSLSEAVASLHLMVPDQMRDKVDRLVERSAQALYGDRTERRTQRQVIREEFVVAVRDDLRVPSHPQEGE